MWPRLPCWTVQCSFQKFKNFREWLGDRWLSYVFGNRKNANEDHKVMSLDRVAKVKKLDNATDWR